MHHELEQFESAKTTDEIRQTADALSRKLAASERFQDERETLRMMLVNQTDNNIRLAVDRVRPRIIRVLRSYLRSKQISSHIPTSTQTFGGALSDTVY